MAKLRVGSLFAGVGGIDLGLGMTGGFETIWQCENDEYATRVLEKHWPAVRRWGDVRAYESWDTNADVVVGGDPCPSHSMARANKRSRHPDLAGYFLAVVGRFSPRWVVRENVPAPTTAHFTAALEVLGYGAIVVQADAAEITGQSRLREFVVAKHQVASDSIARLFSAASDRPRGRAKVLGTRAVIPALTVREFRASPRDCYIYEPDGRWRTLDVEEREAFAGFPRGWTNGLPKRVRCRLLGNAVIPYVAQLIGERILAAERINQEST